MKPIAQSPHIAFIMPALADMAPSGVTTFVRQMVAGFEKYGDRFRVVEVAHGEGVGEVKRETLDVRRETVDVKYKVSGNGIEPAFPLLLSYIGQLTRNIKRVWKVRGEIGRRVIVTNQFGCETLPIALRIVFPRAKIIAISHTHPGQGGAALHPVRCFVERLCVWSMTEVLFNSAASRKLWECKFMVKSIPGAVVHLGTEPPELSIPPDYPPKPDGVVDFICVARFASWKGQMNLVRVWASLIDRGHPRARLILVGDGECLLEVKDEVVRLGLNDSVLFLGNRPHADLYFNDADVAILASTEPEAFGLVLLEAMSRGLPVGASRLGGILEIVVDGETGFLFDPGEVGSITEVITKLATSRRVRERLGGNGEHRWSCLFTSECMVSRFAQAFGLCET